MFTLVHWPGLLPSLNLQLQSFFLPSLPLSNHLQKWSTAVITLPQCHLRAEETADLRTDPVRLNRLPCSKQKSHSQTQK